MSFANSHRRVLDQTVVTEPLVKCTQVNPETLLRVTRLQQDERILVHLEASRGNAVADDLVYHRSCYRKFKALKQFKHSAEEKGDAYRAAYETLFESIKLSVLEGNKIEYMPRI